MQTILHIFQRKSIVIYNLWISKSISNKRFQYNKNYRLEFLIMIDLQKQIDYWINEAADNIFSADILIQKNRFLHGLFFCHLVIEKALKAHVVKETKELAPRTHNLILLSEKAKLKFDDNIDIFLGILMKYQLQGRYPDYNPVIPGKEKVEDYFNQTEKLLQWLKKKL